jgi:hypothetical protein
MQEEGTLLVLTYALRRTPKLNVPCNEIDNGWNFRKAFFGNTTMKPHYHPSTLPKKELLTEYKAIPKVSMEDAINHLPAHCSLLKLNKKTVRQLKVSATQ